MVEIQTVMDRLEALRAYLAEMDHYAQYSLDELTSDFVKYRAAQHSLQLAAQAVVDIAAHVISADFGSRIQDYRQAIEALGKEGVLTPAFAKRLAPIAGFRNILVHEYLAVDPAKLYQVLMNGRADLYEFGRQMVKYLHSTGALNDEAIR